LKESLLGSILGIQQDATTAEIEKSHRQKLIEAQYFVNLSVNHIEAAYLVLIDPDQRQRLDKKLNDASLNKVFHTKDAAPKPRIQPDARRLVRQRRVAMLAGVLLTVFAITLYFYVLRGGAICPKCDHKSLVETSRTGSRVTLSCSRESCGFSFEYDRAERRSTGLGWVVS